MDKYSQSVWWEENGDGSQMICGVCHATDEQTNKRKQAAGFISLEKFEKKVKLAKPECIKKWRELEIKNIYKVSGIQERLVNINGKKQSYLVRANSVIKVENEQTFGYHLSSTPIY